MKRIRWAEIDGNNGTMFIRFDDLNRDQEKVIEDLVDEIESIDAENVLELFSNEYETGTMFEVSTRFGTYEEISRLGRVR